MPTFFLTEGPDSFPGGKPEWINTGADVVHGLGGADVIDGGAMNDTVNGYAGIDTLSGGAGDDALNGGADGDTMSGGDGLDVLNGEAGNDILHGDANNDTLRGGEGSDTLFGDAGNDVFDVAGDIVGATDVDILSGGEGNDTLVTGNVPGPGASISFDGGAGTDTVGAFGSFAGYTFTNIEVLDNRYLIRGTVAQINQFGLITDSYLGSDFTDIMLDSTGTVDFTGRLAAGLKLHIFANGAGNTVIGGDGADRMEVAFPATGAVNFIGRAGDDVLLGGSGDDILEGGAGNDYIYGAAGFNTANYAAATAGVTVNLTIVGAQNTIGAGNDTIESFSIQALTGSAFADTFTGDNAANTLNGAGGADLLRGGAGADTLDGGAAVDTADYSEKLTAVSVVLNVGLNAPVQVGGASEDTIRNIENVNGGAGADSLTGDALVNILRGNAGDDFLAGRVGNDMLVGGEGLDAADYSEKTQAVVIFLNGATNTAVTIGGAAEDTIREIENLNGGSANDSLVGDGAQNILRGNGGADFLFSNGFNPDGTMKALAGHDTLNGDAGDDGLFGGDGNDTLNGGEGADGMVGGAGADTLNGDAGADFLFGGGFSPAGAQLPNSGADTLNGGAGNDGLYGFDGIDTINGDADNDYVEGGAGDDVINGGAGSDYLLGGADADAINGGAGFDYLYGEAGADTFMFRKGDFADWILDFSAAQSDRLRFLDFGYANFAAVPLVDLSTTGNPAVQLTFSGPGGVDQLTIFGVTLAQLNATNVLVT